jgi:hypothetical protein
MGIIPWNSINDVTPVGTTPNPNDGSLDWMIRSTILVPTATGTTTPAVIYQQDDTFAQSAAKRRLGNDKGLLMVIWSESDANMQVAMDVRYLLKE